MTDREMLELAAKAGGYRHQWNEFWSGMYVLEKNKAHGEYWNADSFWNPLGNGGNALELAAFVAIHRTMPDGEAWRPIETAPADTEVVVFWLDPESPEHPERYDFDMLDDGCWRQWTDHYEWAHSVAPAGSRLPREQPPYTHRKPLGTPTRAIDATHSGT